MTTQLALDLPVKRTVPHLRHGIFHRPNQLTAGLWEWLKLFTVSAVAPDTPEGLEVVIRAWLNSEGKRYGGNRPGSIVLLIRPVAQTPALRLYQESINGNELNWLATYTFVVRSVSALSSPVATA